MYLLSWIVVISIIIGIYIYHNKNKQKTLDRESLEEEASNVIVLEDKDWYYSEIEVTPNDNKIYYHSHTPDWDSEFYDINEYKIEGFEVYVRQFESKTQHMWEEAFYDIRDWVVLESDITHRYDKQSEILSNMWPTLKEKIKRLKENCEWHEITGSYKAKYFILSKHPEVSSIQDLRKFFRSDSERIRLWLSKVQELCDKYSLKITPDGFRCADNKSSTEKNYEKFAKELKVILEQVNCGELEIFLSADIIKTLDWYLGG